MEARTIKLSKPVGLPGRATIAEIVMQPPRYEDFVALGEPEIWIPIKGPNGETTGSGTFQADMPTIGLYIERLVGKSFNINLLPMLSLADAMRLKGAVISFFREAMIETGDWTLTTPGTSSPADSSLPTGKASETSAG